MRITSKQLYNIKVQTDIGRDIGVLNYFDIDIDSHTIQNYYIKRNNLLERFLKTGSDIIIHPTQVISITKDVMIVKDSVVEDFDFVKANNNFETT